MAHTDRQTDRHFVQIVKIVFKMPQNVYQKADAENFRDFNIFFSYSMQEKTMMIKAILALILQTSTIYTYSKDITEQFLKY